MHPACSIKKAVLTLAAAILTVACTGCRRDTANSITKGEWIDLLTEKAGMLYHMEEQPYYLNISAQSEHFNAVQAAVEWKILDPAFPFEPDEILNREWTAFTLMNLIRDMPEGNPSAIRDISKTMFAKQVASAVASGLMKTDRRSLFHPKDIMDRDEAENCLDQVVSRINHRTVEKNTMEIDWGDGEEHQLIEYRPTEFDEETMKAVIDPDVPLSAGDLIKWDDGMDSRFYKVASVEGSEAQLEEFDLFSDLESFHIEGHTELDYSQAEIYDGNGNLMKEGPTGNVVSDHIHLMASQTTALKSNIGGFDVSVKHSDGSYTFEAVRKFSDSLKAYASLKLNGFKADYNLSGWVNGFKDSFFICDFTTTETIGANYDEKMNLAGDFSKLDNDQFFASLKNFMQKKENAQEAEIKVASIKIPVSSVPMADVFVDVLLKIKTTGKAEFVLSQNHEIGFEYADGGLRRISEHDNKADCLIKADCSAAGSIKASVRVAGKDFVDAAVTAGAKASVKTTVHAYDSDGKMSSAEVDAPADVADDLAAAAPDVTVCADAKGNWLLEFEVNSAKTLAHKFGMTYKAAILDEKNAPIFPGGVHFENWQAVAACTKKDREKHEKLDEIEAKEMIRLGSYSLIVPAGEARKLEITGLPEGVSAEDLVITSDNPAVAYVSGLGVYGVAGGSAIITITAPDGVTSISCSVIVPLSEP